MRRFSRKATTCIRLLGRPSCKIRSSFFFLNERKRKICSIYILYIYTFELVYICVLYTYKISMHVYVKEKVEEKIGKQRERKLENLRDSQTPIWNNFARNSLWLLCNRNYLITYGSWIMIKLLFFLFIFIITIYSFNMKKCMW